jgi:hypothetical protein
MREKDLSVNQGVISGEEREETQIGSLTVVVSFIIRGIGVQPLGGALLAHSPFEFQTLTPSVSSCRFRRRFRRRFKRESCAPLTKKKRIAWAFLRQQTIGLLWFSMTPQSALVEQKTCCIQLRNAGELGRYLQEFLLGQLQ